MNQSENKFIKKIETFHKGNFKVIKIINTKKIKIFCKIHKKYFIANSNTILRTIGCPDCAADHRQANKKWTLEKFIKHSNEIHHSRYNYSLVSFRTIDNEIKIICPDHGVFSQKAYSHIKGHKCRDCYFDVIGQSCKYTPKEWIKTFRKAHGNLYNYSKCIFIDVDTEVEIICKKHGPFWQLPTVHNTGHGCKKCMGEENSKAQISNAKDFIKKSKKIHGNKYRRLWYAGKTKLLWTK